MIKSAADSTKATSIKRIFCSLLRAINEELSAIKNLIQNSLWHYLNDLLGKGFYLS
ncbi:Hypothetical protein P9211_02661 [Prochlorococcus marinus str. MIT 9211]|uniref:Uncharacterized protein n=1 Tax=Prochlorococcus marinus (strain MIT 9211) TaxID=93059 RepID=A9BDL1_PROM4|nr:Hypothetical protein P9211_02661 [Prochlorococcus marinus str. MIT 9211]